MTLKSIVLWLAFFAACFLPASALTPAAPENHIWEIFSIGYDAPTTEATDLESRTETSTSNYDTAPIHRANGEHRSALGTCALFGQNAEFKAAEELPQLTISASKYPDLIENILNAQRAGHPDILTYGGDAAANRAAALQDVPNIPGLSRDEYPFASSMEGGADSWVGHIHASQQSAQGGLLKNFFQSNGLQSGDQYRVIIGR